MAKPVRVSLVPLGPLQAFEDAMLDDPALTLEQFLAKAPGFALDIPFTRDLLARRLDRLLIRAVPWEEVGNAPLYAPPGLEPTQTVAAQPSRSGTLPAKEQAVPERSGQKQGPAEPVRTEEQVAISGSHPLGLNETDTVAIAYQTEVRKLATFLRARLSLLVSCEKLVVPQLWKQIINSTWIADPGSAGRETKPEPVVLELPAQDEGTNPLGGGGNRLARLREIIRELKDDQILVIPNLDLLGSGGEKGLNRESRELTELIYEATDRLVLAFIDPSLPVPEVIAARFAVRASVEGLVRTVIDAQGREVPIGCALVTTEEAAIFRDFNAQKLYKNIAGLNPLRLRDAMAYAVQVARDNGHNPENPAETALLYKELRAFKAQSAEQFTVPDVKFKDIGGYTEVKEILEQAISLISGAGSLPDEKLRHELVPRGFLFHGPPGTGKTLFAKAVANRLNATVRVVSGPEVTDMYVGESERKVRAIFAEARRNAPSVIVFDEFDSIAARRSGREDGGSRAGNALVAQILTEMDGFRPDVPMLVIGTTNRLELVDQALLRPSRFEPVAIGLPDLAARRHIARIHAQHFHIEVTEELLDIIAQATQGLNGDEIRSLFRDACVGQYYRQPPEPADSYRLGFLIGRIRTRLDARQTQIVEQRPAPGLGERRRPGPGMVALTGVVSGPDGKQKHGT
ncbi:MAG: ATP-binding protein [Planctomycetes bacterium]|nr:ATP-binding protein [Planctomycetota bacterium]